MVAWLCGGGVVVSSVSYGFWWVCGGGFGVWCGGSYGSGVEERKIWWFGFWGFFFFFWLLGLGIGFCLGSKKEMLFNFFGEDICKYILIALIQGL